MPGSPKPQGPTGRLDEGPHLFGVFTTGAVLHAAGRVNSIDSKASRGVARLADGIFDVGGGEAAGMDGVDFDDAAAVTPEQLRRAAQQTGVFIHNAINHDHWKTRLTSPDDAVRKQALANLEHCLRVSAAAGGSGVLIVVGKAEDGPEGPDRARDEIRKAVPLAAALGQRILFENVWNGLFYQDDGPRNQSVRPLADYIDSFKSPWVGSFFDLGNHARYGDVAAWIRELGPRIVKLDIKGYSNAKADAEGKWKGFVDITAGDIDWAGVRAALRDIGFTGWVSAEVDGGDVTRLKVVLDQMKRALVG
jgi:hexulose-6-phosphate isomerase